MKTQFLGKWSFGLALALLPLASGCDQESAISAPAVEAVNAREANPVAAAAVTNLPAPEDVEANLENAPGKIISEAKPPIATRLSATAAEVVKLAHAGVDESVMLAYVTNSSYGFQLAPDDIIYLNDIGVPGSVVTAMIMRDESLKSSAAAIASTTPAYSNQLVPVPGAPTPYATPVSEPETVEAEPQPTEYVESAPAQEPANVTYNYFYDSLAPYGTWIDVGGYGPCWRPTVVVVNPAWRPYGDRGRWVYSDCGWYWASDYSWGWAPFHYGRWFQHSRWGWCWMPDTIWGPSWVSWRYSAGYCGWAPLPPSACWSPGFGFTYFGRSVGISFGFGLTANRYTFVSVNNFCDPHPVRHRLTDRHASQVFNNTVVVNEVVQDSRHRVINRGIPARNIAEATRTELRPVPVREASSPARARMDRGEGGRALTVYRSTLAQPGTGTTPVGDSLESTSRRGMRQASRAPAADRDNVTIAPAANRRDTISLSGNQPPVPARNDLARETPRVESPREAATASPARRTAPLILRGSDRPVTANNDQDNVRRPRTWPAPAASSANRPAPNQFSAPSQPVPPAAVARDVNPSPGSFDSRQRQAPISAPQSRWQYSAPAPSAAPPQNQRSFRQETPQFQQPNHGGFSQPAAPARSQPAVPSYQAPRPAESRAPQNWGNSAAQHSPPPSRPEPAAPRVESRQSPPPSAPSAPHSAPPSRSGGDNNNNNNNNRSRNR